MKPAQSAHRTQHLIHIHMRRAVIGPFRYPRHTRGARVTEATPHWGNGPWTHPNFANSCCFTHPQSGGARLPDGSRSLGFDSARPAALRHARRRADVTTFARAALPPVNCGVSSVCCKTRAALKAGKCDLVERLCREFPDLPICRSQIALGRAEFIPSSNSYRRSSNFFETFGASFGRDLRCKPRYPAENEGVVGAECSRFLL